MLLPATVTVRAGRRDGKDRACAGEIRQGFRSDGEMDNVLRQGCLGGPRQGDALDVVVFERKTNSVFI